MICCLVSAQSSTQWPPIVKQREQNWHLVGGAGRFVGRRPGAGGVGASCSESRVRLAGGLGRGSRRVQVGQGELAFRDCRDFRDCGV